MDPFAAAGGLAELRIYAWGYLTEGAEGPDLVPENRVKPTCIATVWAARPPDARDAGVLGPGAGQDGGTIQFEGVPADLVRAKNSLTGQHLAARG